MTTDLDRLIEAVEAGTLSEDECLSNGNKLPMCATTWDAYNGSIYAAVALCEVLLPGWGWLCGLYGARTWEYHGDEWNPERRQDVEMPFSPARALRLATLRAYRSTRDSQP